MDYLKDVDYIYNYLLINDYFTEEELNLVMKGWGDNTKTYDTICHVRYGMDFDQIWEADNK